MNDWRDRSACLREDPSIFFADRGRISPESSKPCQGCPVRDQCLQFAIESPWEPYGVWGGMQAKQLRPLWRERHPMHSMEVQQLLSARGDRSR